MLDLLIVLAFVAYSVSAGFRSQKKASENLEEYFLAGRSMPGWKAGMSMAATQYAADTPLLVTGLIATGGIFLLWRLWIYGLAFLMMGFILGPAWRRAGILTDAELTETRYSGKGVLALRGLKAIYYGTVINCTVMAMVLVAATRISETFLYWHEWLPAGLYGGILAAVQAVGVPLESGATDLTVWVATTNNVISIFVIVAFTTLYSATGGLRSVIATDVVQFTIAMIATLIYAIVAVTEAGGLGSIVEQIVDRYGIEYARETLSWTPAGGEALLPFLIVIGLQWFFQVNSDGTGYLAQRTMSCRTRADAKMAGFIMTAAQILFRSLFWLPITLALLIVYPFDPAMIGGEQFVANREILFATGIRDLLPAGVRGLMLTGLLAALASTIDTHLRWGASYWSNDVYLRIVNKAWLKREPKSRELVIVARLSNLLVLAIALAIMANLGSIQTAWYLTLLFGAGMGAVLVLRWVWERINLYSEVASIVASLIIAPILLLTVEQEWLKLLLMSAGSTVVMVAVTLLTRPTSDTIRDRFYTTVRPPGFWRRAAARAGNPASEPIRRLLLGVKQVLLSAATVYLLLVGSGKAMFPQPGESVVLAWVLIVLGLATIPFTWRAIRTTHD